jgi:hypothetical protein
MRKSLIGSINVAVPPTEGGWLKVEDIAKAEVTSEDPNFPLEFALASKSGLGWRAATSGPQIIRIIFDQPIPLRQIRLEFSETEIERTQEFALKWAKDEGGPLREIVRQRWNFSPQGSTHEVENYAVDLPRVSVLELLLTPDIASADAIARLDLLRVA